MHYLRSTRTVSAREVPWGAHTLSLTLSLAFTQSQPRPQPRASALCRYQEVTAAMTSRNGYGRGRAWESVGYHANGEADDWGFGERGLLSMSLEVGSSRDGFWPPPSRISTLAAQSVWPAQLVAHRAGTALQLHSVALSGAAADGATVHLDCRRLLVQNPQVEVILLVILARLFRQRAVVDQVLLQAVAVRLQLHTGGLLTLGLLL